MHETFFIIRGGGFTFYNYQDTNCRNCIVFFSLSEYKDFMAHKMSAQ